MAYGLKYWAEFKDDNNSITYRIELLKDSYVSTSTEIVNLGLNPVSISHKGSKDDKDAIIQGSELTFNFWHYKQSNVYDELFESNYKDWKVIFKRNTVKKWEGYIKPENLIRQFLGDKYQISLSATDALADLKEIEYPGTDESLTILEAIKKCTDTIGIALDFKVQLNSYESALMSYNDCALFEVLVNEKRFVKYQDGRAYNDTCYNVLSEILKPFSVTLKQDQGNYWITNYNEANSYVYTFTYSTLAQASRSSSNLIKDITAYDFLSKGELNKIEPLKRVNVTFQNRNLGENIVANPDFGDGLTGWNNGPDPYDSYGFFVNSGHLVVSEDDTFGDANADRYFETNAMYVNKFDDNDHLKFSFQAKIQTATFSSGNLANNPLYFEVYLVHPDNTTSKIQGGVFQPDWSIVTTGAGTLSTSGNYKLRVLIHPDSARVASTAVMDFWEIWFDDFEGLTIYESADITFDRFISGTNTPSPAIKSDERKVFFADANQDNDIGAFKIGVTRTGVWRSYGATEDIELLKLYIAAILRNNALYRNYLRLSIRDESDVINYNDVLKIGTKNYIFTYYQKSYKTNSIECELIELLTSGVTINYASQFLTSIDGKETTTSSTVVTGSGDTNLISDATTQADKTWSSNKINTELEGKASTSHNHAGVYEPVFSKNTGFNKNLGTTAGTVAEGNHTHNYEPAFSKNTAFNKNFAGSGSATTTARSDHNHDSTYASAGHLHDSRYLRKDTDDASGYKITATGFKIGSWEITVNGTTLEFKYNGALQMSLSNAGYLRTKDEQESFGI